MISLKIKINKIYTYLVEALWTVKYLVSPLLAHIINLSFSTGCFINSLKKSRVVPINKSGSKTDANNYIPISILSTLNKCLENQYIFIYPANLPISNCSVQISSISEKKMFRFLTQSSTHCVTFTIMFTVIIPLDQYS